MLGDVILAEWIAAGVAAIAAVASIAFSLKSARNAKLSIETDRVANEISDSALKLQQQAAHGTLISEVRDWAKECVFAISEASHLASLDPARVPEGAFFERRLNCLQRVSALVDIGRWYYPNILTGDYGDWKEKSFKGFRQKALDQLVYTYLALLEYNYVSQSENRNIGKKIVAYQRTFVSEVSKKLEI
ncbi:MAG: hypothetical protein AB3N19_12620 [Ruegeria sp.]